MKTKKKSAAYDKLEREYMYELHRANHEARRAEILRKYSIELYRQNLILREQVLSTLTGGAS